MAMVDQFVKGMFLLVEGKVTLIMDRKYKTQGRQGGLVILDLQNIETGQSKSITIKAGVKMEQIEPDYREMQYSYTDGSDLFFMDMETFETVALPNKIIGDYAKYLKEGEKYVVMFYMGKAIYMRTNPSVELLVTESVDAVRGNTANAATKLVTTETGLRVAVPLFVKQGDLITVNTETGAYTGRA